MRKFEIVRVTSTDNHVGQLPQCCNNLLLPREAILTRRHLTQTIRLHVGCLTSALEDVGDDVLDFPSAERLLARLA